MTIKSISSLRLSFACALLCISNQASAEELYKSAPVLPGGLTVEMFLPEHGLLLDRSPDTEDWASMGLVGELMSKKLYEKDDARTGPRIAEIRQHVLAHDLSSRFEQAMRKKLLASGATTDTRFMPLVHTTGALDRDDAADVPMGPVLMVASRHALPFDMQELYVVVDVALIERRRKSNGKVKEKLLFRRTYSFSARLQPAFGRDPETNLSRWRAIGGTEMGRLLELTMEQATDMIAYDFSPAGRAEGAERVGNRAKRFIAGEQVFGRMLRQEPTWFWARTPNYNDIQGAYPLEAKARSADWR